MVRNSCTVLYLLCSIRIQKKNANREWTDVCADDAAEGRGAARDGEGLGRAVDGVRAGRVLDTTEVPLHPHAHRVVGVGQLQPARVVVIEGEHLTRDPSEVLQASVTG